MRLEWPSSTVLLSIVLPIYSQNYEQLSGSILRLNTAIELEYFLRTSPADCVSNPAKAPALIDVFNSRHPSIATQFKPVPEALCDQQINFAKREELNAKLASWVGLIKVRAQLIQLKKDQSPDARKLQQNLADCLCRAKKNRWRRCVQLLESIGITLEHSTECDPEAYDE